MNKKNIVRIFMILTSFIIIFMIPSTNYYLKNGSIYLFFVLIFLLFLKPLKCLKVKSIKQGIIQYLSGIIIGTILILSVITILVITNTINITSGTYTNIFIIGLISLFWIIQSFFEEYLLRGILYDKIGKLLGYELTILITSFLFTLFHISNNAITFISLINIFLFGLLCGILVKIYKNIYLVSGIHFIWNYLQGNIFGIEVSGNAMNESLFTTILKDNKDLFHGGNFGLEGGIITLIVLIIAIFTTLIICFLNKQKTCSKVQCYPTYFLYKSIDNYFLLSEEEINLIKIDDDNYKIDELMAGVCLKYSNLELLNDKIKVLNDSIIINLQEIELTYLERLNLIEILCKYKRDYYFINTNYIAKKSLEFYLQNY